MSVGYLRFKPQTEPQHQLLGRREHMGTTRTYVGLTLGTIVSYAIEASDIESRKGYTYRSITS